MTLSAAMLDRLWARLRDPAHGPGIWSWQDHDWRHQPLPAPPAFARAQAALIAALPASCPASTAAFAAEPLREPWRAAYAAWLATLVPGSAQATAALQVNDARCGPLQLRSPLHPLHTPHTLPESLLIPRTPGSGLLYADSPAPGWHAYDAGGQWQQASSSSLLTQALADYRKAHPLPGPLVISVLEPQPDIADWQRWLQAEAEPLAELRIFVPDDQMTEAAEALLGSPISLLPRSAALSRAWPADLVYLRALSENRPGLIPPGSAGWRAHGNGQIRPRLDDSFARWHHRAGPPTDDLARLARQLTAAALAGRATLAEPVLDAQITSTTRSLIDAMRWQADWLIIDDPWIGQELFRRRTTQLSDTSLLLAPGEPWLRLMTISRLSQSTCRALYQQLAAWPLAESVAERALLAARDLCPTLVCQAATAPAPALAAGIVALLSQRAGTGPLRLEVNAAYLQLRDEQGRMLVRIQQPDDPAPPPANLRQLLLAPRDPALCRQWTDYEGRQRLLIGAPGLTALAGEGACDDLVDAWRSWAAGPAHYARQPSTRLYAAEPRSPYRIDPSDGDEPG